MATKLVCDRCRAESETVQVVEWWAFEPANQYGLWARHLRNRVDLCPDCMRLVKRVLAGAELQGAQRDSAG